MEELAQLIVKYRHKIGQDINTVSSNTKIRKFIIESIESGEFDKLPAVYGLSFLKSYIKYLEIPESEYFELLTEYEESLNIKKQEYSPQKFRSYQNFSTSEMEFFGFNFKAKWQFFTLISSAGLAVLAIIYFSLFSSPENKIETIAGTNLKDTTITISGDEIEIAETIQDSITLEAFAIDTVWMKVEIDGNRVEEVLLVPNEKVKWKAKDYFLVHQGNVGGLELKRDGKVLEPFGSRGSVVKNVRIMREKILNPNK